MLRHYKELPNKIKETLEKLCIDNDRQCARHSLYSLIDQIKIGKLSNGFVYGITIKMHELPIADMQKLLSNPYFECIYSTSSVHYTGLRFVKKEAI